MKEVEVCDFCGMPIDEDWGAAVCMKCGDRKCVENCIPGGNRTICVECEEKETA